MPTFNAWVTCPKPNPRAQLRLFCFPYAGGGASLFRTWADDLPPEIEVCPIQLPGREGRFNERRYTNLHALVPVLGNILSPYLNLPFTFFGHSLGALLSFELARYFRRQMGLLPMHLFISGHRAPHLPDPHPPIHHLPDLSFIEELHSLNGTPKEVLAHSELMELLIPLLRADFAIAETYVYRPEEALSCPISAFGGTHDQEVSLDELVAWREQTTSAFSARMFSGDHFFLHSNRPLLLITLSRVIEQIVSARDNLNSSIRY